MQSARIGRSLSFPTQQNRKARHRDTKRRRLYLKLGNCPKLETVVTRLCCVFYCESANNILVARMEPYQDLRTLETHFQPPTVDESALRIKQQRSIINRLINVIQEANEGVLTVAGTIDEPDKILVISKLLTSVLADVARA
jgi:hypothetical protein